MHRNKKKANALERRPMMYNRQQTDRTYSSQLHKSFNATKTRTRARTLEPIGEDNT